MSHQSGFNLLVYQAFSEFFIWYLFCSSCARLLTPSHTTSSACGHAACGSGTPSVPRVFDSFHPRHLGWAALRPGAVSAPSPLHTSSSTADATAPRLLPDSLAQPILPSAAPASPASRPTNSGTGPVSPYPWASGPCAALPWHHG